jgi:hypothetical protein
MQEINIENKEKICGICGLKNIITNKNYVGKSFYISKALRKGV